MQTFWQLQGQSLKMLDYIHKNLNNVYFYALH